jgi:hypothetical protein
VASVIPNVLATLQAINLHTLAESALNEERGSMESSPQSQLVGGSLQFNNSVSSKREQKI